MVNENDVRQPPLYRSEDWWAVWLGLFIFILGLGNLFGADILGWVVKTNVWLDLSKALSPVSAAYKGMPGILSLVLTYLFLLVLTSIGAVSMRGDVKRFAIGFSVIFWITYLCWMAGSYAYIAATPDTLKKMGIPWSLSLTGESGFIIALIAGLLIGNLFPGAARYLEEAAKPEWFVKTAIVILGATIGVKACESAGLATTVLFRGLCAIVEAYLIYWPIVYFISRKYFKLTPEWAAPLASGISICGVSAAIATGGAIRSRPVVPCVVSSLVIVFAVVELLILPFLAQTFLYHEPMVAGAWMGLAVKTDGAAAASGAITDALIRAKALSALGVNYEKDWILMAAVTTKVFIDIFIGIWAFVVAVIWVYGIDRRPGEKVARGEIWQRFPKFVIGYVITFLVLLVIGFSAPQLVKTAKAGILEADSLRGIFFALTFFSIGLVSNFRTLRQEGMAKLAGIYLLCLFGFIIWIGLLISWIFFHGVHPPIVGG